MKKYILLTIFLLSILLTFFILYIFLKNDIYIVKDINNFTIEGGEKEKLKEELNPEVENILEDIENYNFMFLLFSAIGGYDLVKIQNKPELMLIYEETKKNKNILNILKEKANKNENSLLPYFIDLIEYNLNLEKEKKLKENIFIIILLLNLIIGIFTFIELKKSR